MATRIICLLVLFTLISLSSVSAFSSITLSEDYKIDTEAGIMFKATENIVGINEGEVEGIYQYVTENDVTPNGLFMTVAIWVGKSYAGAATVYVVNGIVQFVVDPDDIDLPISGPFSD